MLMQLIRTMAERAGSIKYPIAHTKAAVKHRHSGLTGRYQTSVDVHDRLAHALSLLVRYGWSHIFTQHTLSTWHHASPGPVIASARSFCYNSAMIGRPSILERVSDDCPDAEKEASAWHDWTIK